MASTFVITRGKGAVPGKAKQKSVTVTATGTYVAPAGEVFTAKELLGSGRRIVKAIPILLHSQTTPSTSVAAFSPYCEVESSGTKISLHFINPITGAELATGTTITGAKVEMQVTYY